VTQENLDPETPQDRSQELSADDIAESLGITRRTVYRIIEREGWQKIEGLRGRVTYLVPVSFIDAYKAESLKDRKPTDATSQDKTQGGPYDNTGRTEDDTSQPSAELLAVIVRRIQVLEEALIDRDNTIDGLRHELNTTQIELAELKGYSKGKDDVIQAKDETIQAKEQAINAANAAVMLMENQKPLIESPKLEDKQGKPWWNPWGK
jgi:hypothetical protein